MKFDDTRSALVGCEEEKSAHRICKLWKFKPSEADQWAMSGRADDWAQVAKEST